MKDLIVLLDKKEDWQPYFPTDQIVLAKDYLFNLEHQIAPDRNIINLCHNTKYLSLGYYCSLLAEARKHKVFPSVKTINDLSKKRFYLYDMDELQDAAEKAGLRWSKRDQEVKQITFRIFFRETREKEFQSLARALFEHYPCPILEVKMSKKPIWKIDYLHSVGIRDVKEEEEQFFAESLERFSVKIWRLPKNRKRFRYDLAILMDDQEKLPPSNKKAIKLFEQVCFDKGIYSEIINTKDFSRLSEFDALFIRQTTSINNDTYRFAKKATEEQLVVIDDPESILKCTNKIYLTNLLNRNQINTIPGEFVSDHEISTILKLEQELGYPMVLKIPDGSFSIGVKKAESRQELSDLLSLFLKSTALVLVQKFMFTDYDWRIGILNGEAIFACKYYMSKGHWQIYNHNKSGDDFDGESETLRIEDVPERILKVALKSASLIGKGLYGVDLKSQGKDVYVVEVNDNPNIDFGVEDLIYGRKLYEKIVDYFVLQIEKSKKARKSLDFERHTRKELYESPK
jgi:glutathione synthase/RimK-type ligase-like ATP-grasp enzyme